MINIVIGKEAKKILNLILDTLGTPDINKAPRLTGYFKDKDLYICFDNLSGDCWVEETKSKVLAIKWCKGEIEAEQL